MYGWIPYKWKHLGESYYSHGVFPVDYSVVLNDMVPLPASVVSSCLQSTGSQIRFTGLPRTSFSGRQMLVHLQRTCTSEVSVRIKKFQNPVLGNDRWRSGWTNLFPENMGCCSRRSRFREIRRHFNPLNYMCTFVVKQTTHTNIPNKTTHQMFLFCRRERRSIIKTFFRVIKPRI